ncbi:TOMM precursor leader peptide-binding protein [Nocardia nova]
MKSVIRFRRHLGVEAVDDDAVYVFSEQQRHLRLPGRLMRYLAPLLAGEHSREEVVQALVGIVSPARLDRILSALIGAGVVLDADPSLDPRVAGYWDLSGVHGDAAFRCITGSALNIVPLKGISTDDFMAAATALNMTLETSSDLTLVLTDDYLDPALGEQNQQSLANGVAWMPVKPVGATIWIGPIFEPGSGPCWQCLAAYLRPNRPLDDYLERALGRRVAAPLVDLPTTRRLGAELAMLVAARKFAGVPEPAVVWTFDTTAFEWRRHPVRRRPQCPACGDPELVARIQSSRVELVPRRKATVAGGGHRSLTPEQFVSAYTPLISPITGPVTELMPVATPGDGLYVYEAGINPAVPVAGLGPVKSGLRSMAGGKGMSQTQARASAVAEAVERYCGRFQGDEARRVASYAELGESAVEPNRVLLYSEQQFAQRERLNEAGHHYEWVCEPFDPCARIEWTPMWSLSRDCPRYLPTALLFRNYPLSVDHRFAVADANGNAAGSSLEDAVLQGFMELVERDSVALWWYNRVRRPGIDLSSFDVPYYRSWQQRYCELNRETWVLDLTSDMGIPAVAAVSRRTDKPAEDILLGFGSHLNVEVAITRALTEMNQFLPAVSDATSSSDTYHRSEVTQQRWWRTATVDNQPYLAPSPSKMLTAADFDDLSTADLSEDVRLARSIVEAQGMEVLVLNLTRPDIGMPVVKVVVPGLRPFWARFAPGRLYDVPVRMGWLDAPTLETQLNPIPMFL